MLQQRPNRNDYSKGRPYIYSTSQPRCMIDKQEKV